MPAFAIDCALPRAGQQQQRIYMLQMMPLALTIKRDVRRLKEGDMVRVFFRKWPSTAHAWHYGIYIGRDLEEITRGTELRLQHRFVHYDGRLSTSNILGFAGKHKPITDLAVGTSSSTGKFCR